MPRPKLNFDAVENLADEQTLEELRKAKPLLDQAVAQVVDEFTAEVAKIVGSLEKNLEDPGGVRAAMDSALADAQADAKSTADELDVLKTELTRLSEKASEINEYGLADQARAIAEKTETLKTSIDNLHEKTRKASEAAVGAAFRAVGIPI